MEELWIPKTEKKHVRFDGKSKVKIPFIVFLDYNGVICFEFLPPDWTVNKEYYLEILRRFRKAIRWKRPEIWEDNSWQLHHGYFRKKF